MQELDWRGRHDEYLMDSLELQKGESFRVLLSELPSAGHIWTIAELPPFLQVMLNQEIDIEKDALPNISYGEYHTRELVIKAEKEGKAHLKLVCSNSGSTAPPLQTGAVNIMAA